MRKFSACLALLGTWLLILLWGMEPCQASAPPPRVMTSTVTLPTYPYAPYLMTAYTSTYNVSYPVLDWDAYLASQPTPSPQTYTLVVMSNEYLTVTVMPELGGRVYQLIERQTGYNHLYQNPAIKPTAWGPHEQGWWLNVGGIEWCLPVSEHGYEWGVPWKWAAMTTTAGATVTVWDTDARDRPRLSVSLTLPADRAALIADFHLENPTAHSLHLSFWDNAGVALGAANHPTAGYAFVFPTSEMTIHSSGDERFPHPAQGYPTGPDYTFSWPVYQGIDYAHLRNWQQWLGFFVRPDTTEDFAALYDGAAGVGIVHTFPHHVARGLKGFAPGWGDEALPHYLWTDDASGSVEIQSGLAPTYWDRVPLAAGHALDWSETWYPVGAMGQPLSATEEAALAAQVSDGQLTIGLHATSERQGELRVWERATCALLQSQALPSLSPRAPYTTTLEVGNYTLEQLAISYADTTGHRLVGLHIDECPTHATPPHLVYGLNVRDTANLGLVAPTGFGWVKLWEMYSGLPHTALPYHVLYSLDCLSYIENPQAWAEHVTSVAQAGRGYVDAYEICNEPNRGPAWGNRPPDPARFTAMLCQAYERIKAVDPGALVISGGLAPVGRVTGNVNGWPGNNGAAMDEQTYLRSMLSLGAGRCMDAFGYHPYGFAYEPERDPATVSNGFTFRGAETMHAIMAAEGWGHVPMWATEFNWLRDPAEDGRDCSTETDFSQYFAWMKVSADAQANYLERAFAYADSHWPWMQGMFIWNLDWHTYKPEHPCLAARYFSLRRDDGSEAGAATPAYHSLATMPKRPAPILSPTLEITPLVHHLWVCRETLHSLTLTLTPRNAAGGILTWTVHVAPASEFTPTLPLTRGRQGEPLPVIVEPATLPLDDASTFTIILPETFTATLTLSATTPNVRHTPQNVTLTLHVIPAALRLYLPLIIQR